MQHCFAAPATTASDITAVPLVRLMSVSNTKLASTAILHSDGTPLGRNPYDTLQMLTKRQKLQSDVGLSLDASLPNVHMSALTNKPLTIVPKAKGLFDGRALADQLG